MMQSEEGKDYFSSLTFHSLFIVLCVGYGGNDCMTVVDENSLNYSPALLGLIITLFIIVLVLIGSIALMIKQIAAFKEDMSNYQVLKGGDESSASL